PMPVTITRPRQSRSSSTARANPSSRRSMSPMMAAASVCRTLRASDRSVSTPRGSRGSDDGIDLHQLAEKRLDQIESQGILAVALRPRRLFVHFEEHAVDAGTHTGA